MNRSRAVVFNLFYKHKRYSRQTWKFELKYTENYWQVCSASYIVLKAIFFHIVLFFYKIKSQSLFY